MPHHHGRRRLLIALAGIAFGAVLFVLALRQVRASDILAVLRHLSVTWTMAAWLAYALAIALRAARWRLLLLSVTATAPLPDVAETLLVGYAVNNVLPARLGEVFRADYAARRLPVGRAGAFGSIIAERLLDGVVIVGLLWIGLVLTRVDRGSDPGRVLVTIAGSATGLLAVLALVLWILARTDRLPARLPAWLGSRLQELLRGVASLGSSQRPAVALLSVVIWAAETVALFLACRATGLALSPRQAMVLMGAASLSTLVPTAPAFLGSYQYVFVVAMRAFSLPQAAGLVAATVIQVVFYGTVTVTGLGLLVGRASTLLRRGDVDLQRPAEPGP
jgi:uncharacterized protein (TIRG00374 family)